MQLLNAPFKMICVGFPKTLQTDVSFIQAISVTTRKETRGVPDSDVSFQLTLSGYLPIPLPLTKEVSVIRQCHQKRKECN